MMMIAVAAFGFAACEPSGEEDQIKGKLATPELTETHTETSITVSWGAVEHADSYVVLRTGEKAQTTEALSYTFENLNAGSYTIRVVAKGNGYEDSDSAQINVTLTGATEVDWFTQTLSLPAEGGETIETANGPVTYMPFDSVKVRWEGTGVADVKYALFATEDLANATDAQIKENLTTPDGVADWCAEINAEGGLEIVFGPGLYGSTSYTACVMVTNENGLEFFTKNEITTAEAVVSDATNAWLGTYTAYTEKTVDLTAETNAIKNQRTDFTFEVVVVPGTANQVMVDGISIIGEGTPAYGEVVESEGINYLVLINNVAIADIGNGYLATWLPYCVLGDGRATFVTGEFGAIYLAMAADGTITYEAGAGQLSDGSTFEVAAFDVIALGSNLGILQDEDGNPYSVWKYGDWKEIKKSEAAASAKSVAPKQFTVAKLLPESMLY